MSFLCSKNRRQKKVARKMEDEVEKRKQKNGLRPRTTEIFDVRGQMKNGK